MLKCSASGKWKTYTVVEIGALNLTLTDPIRHERKVVAFGLVFGLLKSLKMNIK